MTLTTEQLAELLAGIARAQQAIVDAVESESGGFRSTHMLPKITTAANLRLATPRLIDIPSRVLLRAQSRVPMDVPTIMRMLEEATGAAPSAAPAVAKVAVAAGAAAAAATAAAVATGAVGTESTPAAGGDDLSSFFDS